MPLVPDSVAVAELRCGRRPGAIAIGELGPNLKSNTHHIECECDVVSPIGVEVTDKRLPLVPYAIAIAELRRFRRPRAIAIRELGPNLKAYGRIVPREDEVIAPVSIKVTDKSCLLYTSPSPRD